MTKDGDNCGNGHFSISCLFRGCYRMVAGIFPRSSRLGALNRFRHLRFSCSIWLINKALSTFRMELFYFSLSAAARTESKPINSILYDPARLPAGYYCAPDTLSRYSWRGSRAVRSQINRWNCFQSAKRDFRCFCTTQSRGEEDCTEKRTKLLNA